MKLPAPAWAPPSAIIMDLTSDRIKRLACAATIVAIIAALLGSYFWAGPRRNAQRAVAFNTASHVAVFMYHRFCIHGQISRHRDNSNRVRIPDASAARCRSQRYFTTRFSCMETTREGNPFEQCSDYL